MLNRDSKESTTTTSAATVNYDLPQWNGEDVTSWMTNLNDAFNKIDSAMWANHTAMAGYDKIASDLQKLAEGIQVDNEEIREALRIVQQGMADQLTQLNQAKTDITNANLAISQLQTEDNALSAMIEDLQDDVGKMMRWFTATSKDVNIAMHTEYDGNTVNAHVDNLMMMGPILQMHIVFDSAFDSKPDTTMSFHLTRATLSDFVELSTDAFIPWDGSTTAPLGYLTQHVIGKIFSKVNIYTNDITIDLDFTAELNYSATAGMTVVGIMRRMDNGGLG